MFVNGIYRDYIIHDDENIKGFFGEYRWLSNFHECPILWQGFGFTSTEAAYQASKTTSKSIAKDFQNYNPSQSKQHGKLITVRKDWPNIKFDIMAQIVLQKFLIHADLREKLLETGNKYLEETNHWGDIYWGVCNGVGESKLGKVLMATRAYLQNLENTK